MLLGKLGMQSFVLHVNGYCFLKCFTCAVNKNVTRSFVTFRSDMDIENEDYEFDRSDLTSRPSTSQFQVSPIQPVETIETFLGRVLQQDSLPKEDVRREWNNTKSERQKLQKQLNKSNEAIEYWISKRKFISQQLNNNSQKIERLRGRMLADCLSET